MTRKSYPTDLKELQWLNIAHLIPGPKPGGRPRQYCNRDLLDAVFYLLSTGCSWRSLPHDFPPWESVYAYFRLWQSDGTWQRIHEALRREVRGFDDRAPGPTAAVLDSQSVKTTSRGGDRGYDAGKKNRRPQAPYPRGHDGSVADGGGPRGRRAGSRRRPVLKRAKAEFPSLQLIWADGGYAGALIDWVKTACGWVLQTVLRPAGVKGFVLLPRRWVVERTFAWLSRYRRLGKDYEYLTAVSETMILVAMIHIMARRTLDA